MMIIKNKIYSIDFDIYDEYIFINKFYIEPNYRHKGYSRRIINTLKKKYNKSIILECWVTLIDFYKKLRFEIIGKTYDNYFEMILK